MSFSGFSMVIVSAVMTMAANLLLRAGIVQAGGFNPDGPFEILVDFLKLLLQPLFAAGFIIYFLAALIWFRVIALEPLSVAYPVLVGLTFILVTSGAFVVFREPISIQKVLGLTLILAGIMIASASNSVHPP